MNRILKGSQFSVKEQFPSEIEESEKKIPCSKKDRKRSKLVRDTLYTEEKEKGPKEL